MKRKIIIKLLARAGYKIGKGKKHDHILDQNNNFISVLGRHTEIDDFIVREIEKQTGVKLL